MRSVSCHIIIFKAHTLTGPVERERRTIHLICACSTPAAPSISVGSSPTGASAEAVAADDVEDDIEYGDGDLRNQG